MKSLSQRELDETLAASEGVAAPPRPRESLADDDTVASAPPRAQQVPPSRPGEEDTRAATGPDPYAHLDDTVAEAMPRLTAPASTLSAGQVVGRLVILSQLGAGGMGVVYSAYDPELDRKVALKVIRSEMGWSEEARTRLLREAQALARLQHPNVVAVHDVGTHDEQVWIAMEFVKGQTLRDWLGARPRSWRDIVRVMRRAGRGVAAAHDAGLLHRDLKPDNIMIATDGRARVMDFGLARGEDQESSNDVGRRLLTQNALSTELTQLGAILGTPGYMAPEQFIGADVDPRTDQFALCVTLWEALYGQRPFAGETFEQLAQNVTAGRLQPPPSGASAPRWLRRVLERGLQVSPERRYPSVDALLTALKGAHTTRRFIAGALAGVVLLCAGAVGLHRVQHQRALERCQTDGDAIAGVWDGAASARVTDALLGTGVSFAADAVGPLIETLDDYTTRWRAQHVELCVDELEQRRDPAMIERARLCLEQGSGHARRLIALLSSPGEDERALATVERAANAVLELPPLEPCADPKRLRTRPLPPTDPSTRAEVQRIRETLAESAVLVVAGRHDESLALSREARAEADALGWGPLRAEAAFALGQRLVRVQSHQEAELALEDALALALEFHEDDLAVTAAQALGSLIGVAEARVAEGRRWLRVATALLDRENMPTDDLRRARSLEISGDLARLEGSFADAQTSYERALELTERALGPEHPDTASKLNKLAAAHLMREHFESARELLLRALAITERAYGPEHPTLADSITNLGIAEASLGRVERATQLLERALRIERAAFGQDNPVTAGAVHNLATMYAKIGDVERAVPLLERALALDRESLGATHPELVNTLTNLGQIYLNTGDVERARRYFAESIEILEGAFDEDHPGLVDALSGLAMVHAIDGDHERSFALHERAIELAETKLGPSSIEVALALLAFGQDLAGAGQLERGIQTLERAATFVDALDSAERALISSTLAALYVERGDVERARPLLERLAAPSQGDEHGEDDRAAAEALALLAELELEARDAAQARRYVERARARFTGEDPLLLGQLDVLLARALASGSEPPPRAELDALLGSARERLASAGPEGAAALEELEAWARSLK